MKNLLVEFRILDNMYQYHEYVLMTHVFNTALVFTTYTINCTTVGVTKYDRQSSQRPVPGKMLSLNEPTLICRHGNHCLFVYKGSFRLNILLE